MAQSENIFPIPGTKRVKYVEENIKAINVELSPEDLQQIENIFPKDAAAGTRYHEAAMKSVNL